MESEEDIADTVKSLNSDPVYLYWYYRQSVVKIDVFIVLLPVYRYTRSMVEIQSSYCRALDPDSML